MNTLSVTLIAVMLASVPAMAQEMEESAASESEESQPLERLTSSHVQLQALDKITGHVKTLDGQVGQVMTFGTLSIQVDRCGRSKPEDMPDAVAYVRIQDSRQSEKLEVFSGWMFASRPNLNALEHPVYDVWVSSCAQ